MDQRLLTWAVRLKRRRARRVRPCDRELPVLFLFTDDRLPDPAAAVRRWPSGPPQRGLFGIVLRGRDPTSRLHLARSLHPLCRTRGIAMVVAGDPCLAVRLGVGIHLAGGAAARRCARRRTLRSASVHGMAELVAAHRHGAALCFLSPVFPTASHPGAPALGTLHLARLAQAARRLGLTAFALGGVDGARVRALPPAIDGIGAIAALAA